MNYLTLLLLLLSYSAHSQTTYEYIFNNPNDSSYNCSLTILPDSGGIKGLIVRDYTSLPDIAATNPSPYQWRKLALNKGFAIVYTTTSDFFPGLCYTEDGLVLLDELLHQVIQKHTIPTQNIFIGGLSASGTRAMRYAQYCEQGKSKYGIHINSVFSVDSPLDLERFYQSVKNNKKNFKAGMLEEAQLMEVVFPLKLGSLPENAAAYRKNSVYSYLDSTGGNAKYLLNTPILLFHEPDIDWWLAERGCTYLDINSFDVVGLYNWLKQNGHIDIELVTTTHKGFDRNGNRKCHSWTIVDEEYLIQWMVNRLDE